MELSQLPLVLLLISNVYSQHTEERPKPKVTIKPDEHVFRGETVTLRCDIYSEGVTSWEYIWNKDGSFYTVSELQELTISPVTEFDADKYSCYRAERGGSCSSSISDEVTLTVSVPRAVLSVSPQKWLTEGDSVTLICQVNGSSTGWTFSWYTETVSSANSINYKQLSDSSRGAGGHYTVSSAALKHTGVHVCRAERGKPAYNSTISNTQLIWVTGVSPPVSLIVSPSRTQHFTSDSLSLSCEDQSNSTGWRMRRYRDSGLLEDCSSVWGSQTGSTCTIRSTIPEDTGVYWCESESGEKHHPVNITVHFGVILESPVHPVTEGETLTLRCLYHHSTPPNLRADFYKDGSLIQNQTTEMIIPAVSKSHEGFYYCKHTERGESRKSWISVTVGVTAGLTFLITVFLVLLWRYRNNKGGRSQSASSVSQQQNSSQTSEQNQSEAGHKTLKSGTAHIYDSLDATINKNISTDIVSGPNEVTYAEIELKSTEKQKKKKENKGNTSESSDTVYSQLNLVTHQAAGSSDVMYAQVK
ncbi:Fc receptor-like protein 5 [Sinocyclocheilus grahami]|uniref:Fc receptor-like protein 5 n=1 Tax=Sinocyclocheilus grahami TaxID=75366 RepID=UPI0007AC68BD|nr:PREDICTED: Fc receptor-like protein 5 [Sinocyclocheilus grahami]